MTTQEIKQICKANRNIVKWLGNEPVWLIVEFKDNSKIWYLINNKVYFTFDTTKPYARQHQYLRVLKATNKVIKYAGANAINTTIISA